MLSDVQIERYSRQIILPEVGGRGQLALLASTVTICGDSDLATTAALYLAGAGVGCLRVSPPIAAAIEGLNPDCHVVIPTSALDVVHGAAAVLCVDTGDATCAQRYAACLQQGVPWIIGAAAETTGWMCAIGGAGGPCYTCLMRQRRCAGGAVGLLATATAAFMGTLLATEAIGLVLSLRQPSLERCVTFDALRGDVRVDPVERDPQCAVCRGRA